MSEKFFLLNSNGKKIVGLADYQKKKAPAVIICPGFKGVKEEKHLEEIARRLFRAGFSVFRFDFTQGMGESFGSIENITITQQLHDLKSVVNFVHENLNVESSRIGVVGHSLGGMVAVLYAPSDKKVKAIASIAPVMKLENSPALNQGLPFVMKWQKQGFQTFRSSRTDSDVKVNYSFWEDGKKYDTREAIQKVKVPVLLVHGDKDRSVPLESTMEVYSLAREPKKLFIVKGADHIFSGRLDELSSKVAEWFAAVLR